MRLNDGRKRLAGLALAGMALATIAGGAAQSADEAAAMGTAADLSKMSKDEIETHIYERQQVMGQLEKDADLLGDIVAGVGPKDKLGEVTASIAKSARESHEAFALKIPGGHTKPEAWTNWADFSKRLDAFVASTANLEKLGATGSVHAVTDVLGDAMPCKACHDLYREPKKPAA